MNTKDKFIFLILIGIIGFGFYFQHLNDENLKKMDSLKEDNKDFVSCEGICYQHYLKPYLKNRINYLTKLENFSMMIPNKYINNQNISQH